MHSTPEKVNAGERPAFILVTDIHRSTRLWESYRSDFKDTLEMHNGEVETNVRTFGGEIMKNLGDGYIAIFHNADGCIGCGVEIQRKLSDLKPLPDGSKLQIRVVAHGGQLMPLTTGKGYFGQPLNRASRICQVCHPGQMLLSEAAKSFLSAPPENARLIDLGVHRLRDLAEPERLYQVDHPDFEIRDFEPLPTLAGYRPNNLLIQPNAFVGREKELAELKEIFVTSKHRLVTITAAGGYGKSRLSMQLCADLLDNYKDGVYAVMLAPIGDFSRVASATADALGIKLHSSADPAQQLSNYIREKEMLVYFDNFEHVLPAGAFLSQILQHAPSVSILATSREPLRLQGELKYALKPLKVQIGKGGKTDGISDAATLFLNRAKLVNSDMIIDEKTIESASNICSKLSGVPLAIELAAAWADSYTLKELGEELDNQLELAARNQDIDPRHKSIRASLDWSYGMLSSEQRRLLNAVSLFKGGFFTEAAKGVIPLAGLRLRLAELCDKSWLFTRDIGGETRFYVRDAAAREYAMEKLKESGNWSDVALCHSEFFAGFCESASAGLMTANHAASLKTFNTESENFYEALDTALNFKHNIEPESRRKLLNSIVPGLFHYLDTAAKWNDGLKWVDRLLSVAEEISDKNLRARAKLYKGRGLCRAALYIQAEEIYEDNLAAALEAEDKKIFVDLCRTHGLCASMMGMFETGEKRLNDGVRVAKEIGYDFGAAACLNNLAVDLRDMGRLDEACEILMESYELRKKSGDREGMALSLYNLGSIYEFRGKLDEAEKAYLEGLEIYGEFENVWGRATGLNSISSLLWHRTRFDEADECAWESHRLFDSIGDHWGTMSTTMLPGETLWFRGKYDEALKLLGPIVSWSEERNFAMGMAYGYQLECEKACLDGNFAAAREAAEKVLKIRSDIKYPLGIAMSFTALGDIDIQEEKTKDASERYKSAVEIAEKIGDESSVSFYKTRLGLALTLQGNYETAGKYISKSIKFFARSGYFLHLIDALYFGALLLWLARHIGESKSIIDETDKIRRKIGYLLFGVPKYARVRTLRECGLAEDEIKLDPPYKPLDKSKANALAELVQSALADFEA